MTPPRARGDSTGAIVANYRMREAPVRADAELCKAPVTITIATEFAPPRRKKMDMDMMATITIISLQTRHPAW